MIEEVKWNSCKVTANSFTALLNEQNLELIIQAPQLVNIPNSQQVGFLPDLNKADTAQSSPLCQFSSLLNDYVDFVVPPKKISRNSENQYMAEESCVHVIQPTVKQLSSSVAQNGVSENTPKTPQKISTVPFDSDEVSHLRTFFNTSTLNFLNNVATNDILKK
ncbi:uncharacterized protein LOC136096859 [Hydra vulgaris]|uniref:uncharacterized protein LOC136096859 n=1 Tax=Hydra vulgaris TaxID=6087 RepID=UPI0032EA3B85